MNKLRLSVLFFFFFLLIIVVLVAASIGGVPITPKALLSGKLNDIQSAVFFSIRLPRILLAIIVGSSLAVSGAAMQSLFRNPLADPGLIGISSGAALGVAAVIVLLKPVAGSLGIYSLSIAAFIGGLITCLLIFRFARLIGYSSVTYMLLAGIAINALAGSGTGFLTYLSNDEQLRTLTFWTMGSLGGALWPAVIVASTLVIPAIIIFLINAHKLNIMLLGEEEAQHLGVDIKKLKNTIIICTALSVGASVAVSGIIGFIGLVVPHLIRLTIGPDHRLLIPSSALLGSVLLLVSDTVARTIVSPAEMPVGIITSIIGGPFFLWLLIRQFSGRFGF